MRLKEALDRAQKLELELGQLRQAHSGMGERLAASEALLQRERECALQEQGRQGQQEQQFREAFAALSSEALRSNSERFLELAQLRFTQLEQQARSDWERREASVERWVQPVGEGLRLMGERLQAIELQRGEQAASLTELLHALGRMNEQTQVQTQRLSEALKAPQVRGQWGEMQLRRTVELAGMLPYCDFVEQVVVEGDQTGSLRPDLVVRLPNQRVVVVDAKAPLAAYLEAMESGDAGQRHLKLQEHARHLRDHVRRLSQKAYHEHLQGSPEFVVLFLPGEVFYSAALEQDPALIEHSVERKVLIATPTTLIALLKAIAYGWKQQEVALQADRIAAMGRELHESASVLFGHLAQLRRSLLASVQSFNQAARSCESRFLPRLRRFEELGAGSSREVSGLSGIDVSPEASGFLPASDEGAGSEKDEGEMIRAEDQK
jgi:DNA recombination protein RmuC